MELEPGAENHVERLRELENLQARVYLLHARYVECKEWTVVDELLKAHTPYLVVSLADADSIFKAAASLNLTDAGHVWLVTEQLLQSPEIPVGAIGLKLLNADNETAHIRDSL